MALVRSDRSFGRSLRLPSERGTRLHRDRLRALLDSSYSFSVVRAPVGFGKSVLIADWLSELRADAEQVLLLSAERTKHRSTDLWSAIASGIGPFVDETGGRQGSRRWNPAMTPQGASPAVLSGFLKTLTEPLTLVIDDFEQATESDVTGALVKLTDDCELLHLVLVGRTIAGIDDHYEHASPNTIVSEADLMFTRSETAAILRTADPSLSNADLAAAHQRLRGWPLATARLADNLSESPQTDLAGATITAARRACRDLAVAVGIDQHWLGVASMASELNLEIAGLLLKDQGDRAVEQRDDPDAAVLLDRLERNGILAPPDLAFEGRWRAAQWSPTLRRVIRDDFVRRYPALTSGIDAVMADWYVANGAPGRSLTHAARAGQWDLLFSLLKTHSTSVLDGDWQEFSRAVTAAPYEVISNNAVGATWRAIALNLPIDPQVTPDPRRLTSEEAAVIGRSPRAREELQDQFWQHMLYRRRGLFEQARIASDNAKKIMQEAILVGTQGVVGLQSLVLTHSGYLHEILGDLRTATGEFIEAHKQAPLSELSFSAADAAGKAALSSDARRLPQCHRLVASRSSCSCSPRLGHSVRRARASSPEH